MVKILKKIFSWFYRKFQSLAISIGILLYNVENDVFKKVTIDVSEKDKRVQRKIHRNPVLEKFYAGVRDEQYYQQFYEILRKADEFQLKANSKQRWLAIDRHMRHLYNEEYQYDGYGRKIDYGNFFGRKNENEDKTLMDVLTEEMRQRRTNDDDFELLYIFNNTPIKEGVKDLLDFVVKKEDENNDTYVLPNILEQAKKIRFPIKVHRENDNVVNKIETLTEFLHVKKIGFEYRQLEFFIPLKFKINEVQENSEIFNELVNIKNVFVSDKYGKLIGFTVDSFIKRIKFGEHEVWKFQGKEMTNMIN